MKKLILKHSTGKNVLVFFVLSTLVYIAMLAFSIPKTAQFANGMKLPDMMPEGYSSAYIMELFTALGEAGRNMYLQVQLPLDMVYPFLFALCYSLLFAYFLKKIKKEHSLLLFLCFLPVIGGVADYFENIGLFYLLKNFPNFSEQTVDIVSGFTVLKSTVTSIYFASLLFVLVVLALQKIKWKR